MEQIGSILRTAIALSREDRKALPVFVKTTKMVEEAGELCEAALQNHGYVAKDKAGVGTVLEESADMFFQVIDILQAEYPDYGPSGLLLMFEQMLAKKLDKWVSKKMDLPEGAIERATRHVKPDVAPINVIAESGDPKNPKPGDHFAVRVGNKWYDTVIDPHGTQRFVINGPVNALIDHQHEMFDTYWMQQRIANHPAVYSLNEIAIDFQKGKWSLEEMIEFYTMFGYSVSGFASLSFVEDVEIDNPLWSNK